jgi:hypothetical protein
MATVPRGDAAVPAAAAAQSTVSSRDAAPRYGAYDAAVKQARAIPIRDGTICYTCSCGSAQNSPTSNWLTFSASSSAGGDVFRAAAAVVNTLHLLTQHPAVATRLRADFDGMARRKPDH